MFHGIAPNTPLFEAHMPFNTPFGDRVTGLYPAVLAVDPQK